MKVAASPGGHVVFAGGHVVSAGAMPNMLKDSQFRPPRTPLGSSLSCPPSPPGTAGKAGVTPSSLVFKVLDSASVSRVLK